MFDSTDVHVAEVRIEGNNRTKDVVIERELQEAYQATNFATGESVGRRV